MHPVSPIHTLAACRHATQGRFAPVRSTLSIPKLSYGSDRRGVRLKILTRSEGRIRLSEDDGPSATEFLGDDYDEDNESMGPNDVLRTERPGGLRG